MGRLPEWENGYVAARVGTLGMTYSSGTGKVMADLIANGGIPPYRLKNMLEHLSPARG
jgi:glycine/D-amino acid oxidase-like deaminating enzyme